MVLQRWFSPQPLNFFFGQVSPLHPCFYNPLSGASLVLPLNQLFADMRPFRLYPSLCSFPVLLNFFVLFFFFLLHIVSLRLSSFLRIFGPSLLLYWSFFFSSCPSCIPQVSSVSFRSEQFLLLSPSLFHTDGSPPPSGLLVGCC